MTDEELVALNQKGFIPGPSETESEFLDRVKNTGKHAVKLGGESIPSSHWQWVCYHLKERFDFEPHSLPAFYSNRLLAPWQGAAAWILEGKLVAIQLRKALRKGSYLGLYQREEILAHEAVHAARSAFSEKKNEEFFAYMTSLVRWRRILGPIIQSPWEVWPFLVAMLVGMFFQGALFFAALWLGLGFCRLIRQHRILKKTYHALLKVSDKPFALMLRLTDTEIRQFGKLENIQEYAEKQTSLRWRLIRLAYLK
ncbi:MAG: hypothetical protein HY069_04700 [Chlamydiia bacterium]|nr:hypothetical protein [Chlamydiia bacterium]